MKKFLSIFLAVAFVFAAMCLSVSAAAEHVIGSQGETSPGGVGNGVTSWSESNVQNNEQDITINFESRNGQSIIENRYAIDITYSELIVDLSNIEENNNITYQWDVNKHVYIPSANEDTVNNSTITIENAFYITNHSDLEIYYTPILTNNQSSLMTMTIKGVTDSDSDKFFMVERAMAGTYRAENDVTEGSAQNGAAHKIEIVPYNSMGWLAVINQLGQNQVANGAVIGTLTISFKATIDTGESPVVSTQTANS